MESKLHLKYFHLRVTNDVQFFKNQSQKAILRVKLLEIVAARQKLQKRSCNLANTPEK